MMDSRAAKRYAQALFNLSTEQNLLDSVDESLLRIKDLLLKHPEITHLLLNSTIGQAEKEDFLDKVLPEEMPALIHHFLKLLVRKGRFNEFSLIQNEFHRLTEEKKGIQEVLAISASPLESRVESKIKNLLEKKLSRKIRLATETDTSLIGGLILRFGGREIDASYKNRLWEIKQKLMAL